MTFNQKIKEIAKSYFDELDKNDFSHGFSHVERVTRLVLKIGREEKADLEILEVAALLHDIARIAEDNGEVEDHAAAAAEKAQKILESIGFPKEKINNVCHCIEVHRSRSDKPPLTLEAKILQDADRLDALGAVDVCRVLASTFQAKSYQRDVYVDKPYEGETSKNLSAIHYMISKVIEPKRKPENFNTESGRKMAQERYMFSVEYIDRFIKEWRGEL